MVKTIFNVLCNRFVDAVLEPNICEHFVHMPNNEEMQDNMSKIEAKYKIPGIIAEIDGCHFSVREKPR